MNREKAAAARKTIVWAISRLCRITTRFSNPGSSRAAPDPLRFADDVDFLLGHDSRRFRVMENARAEDALVWETPLAEPFRQGAARTGVVAGADPRCRTILRSRTCRSAVQPGAIAIPRPERRWLVTARELVETLLLAVLIFLAVRASFQNFRVEGASMQPSLQDGEYLIVNKLSYAEIDMSIFDWLPFYDADEQSVNHIWDSPSRGDIIVFQAPTSTSRDFIKRIIGLPGDTVEINESTGEVSVNGEPLPEPYIQGQTTCSATCMREIPEANTPESQADCGSNACYFVLGDNRQNSSDSRQGWLVPEENIIGKALITYWHEGNLDVNLAPNHSPEADKAAAEE